MENVFFPHRKHSDQDLEAFLKLRGGGGNSSIWVTKSLHILLPMICFPIMFLSFQTQVWANSADPEEQSDQGLHCLPSTSFEE